MYSMTLGQCEYAKSIAKFAKRRYNAKENRGGAYGYEGKYNNEAMYGDTTMG